jgi:hypothetical protein
MRDAIAGVRVRGARSITAMGDVCLAVTDAPRGRGGDRDRLRQDHRL